jgi:hypothetical protein
MSTEGLRDTSSPISASTTVGRANRPRDYVDSSSPLREWQTTASPMSMGGDTGDVDVNWQEHDDSDGVGHNQGDKDEDQWLLEDQPEE